MNLGALFAGRASANGAISYTDATFKFVDDGT